jgi:hypothetical protein
MKCVVEWWSQFLDLKCKIKKERDADRQRDQGDRETKRQRDKETKRQRETERDRETEKFVTICYSIIESVIQVTVLLLGTNHQQRHQNENNHFRNPEILLTQISTIKTPLITFEQKTILIYRSLTIRKGTLKYI